MKIRIAIADDHPMIISGLQNMLSGYSHISLGKTYNNGAELLEGLQEDVPDILLLDIQMPGKTGDQLTPLLLKKHPALKILTLTNFNSALYIHNMFRFGVQGYILKTTDPQTLINAIEIVHNGGQFVDPSMQEKLDQFAAKMKKDAGMMPTLTIREKEILNMIINGATTQEISDKLFIGLRTVEYYRSNLFVKLEVKNMAALIKKALELGLAE